MFVSAGLDLHLHSISEDGCLEKYPVQSQPTESKIIDVSWCNDNSYIAILRENEKPQILATKDKSNIRLIHVINITNISALCFKHNTKKYIALGTNTGDVLIYDTKARTTSYYHPDVTNFIKSLEFTCDDQQLCGINADTLFVFPDISRSGTFSKFKQQDECTCLKCHPFIATKAAIGYKRGNIGIWDLQSCTETINIEVLNSPVTGISMSSCSNYLIACGNSLKICGLDYKNSNTTFHVELENEKCLTCDLSSDDRFLVVGSADGYLKVYDIKQQAKQIHNEKSQAIAINKVIFENMPQDLDSHSNFSSMVKLSEVEIKDDDTEGSPSATSMKKMRNCSIDSLEKMKKSLLNVVKTEMDCLESQLNEHCAKFQKFLDNEFETIDNIIKKKWDIFNVGDMNQIMKAICPDESSSAFQ